MVSEGLQLIGQVEQSYPISFQSSLFELNSNELPVCHNVGTFIIRKPDVEKNNPKKKYNQLELVPFSDLQDTIQLIADVEYSLDQINSNTSLDVEDFKNLRSRNKATPHYWEAMGSKDVKVDHPLTTHLMNIFGRYYGIAMRYPEIESLLKEEKIALESPQVSYILTESGIKFLSE